MTLYYNKNPFIAIIGDIRNSRKLETRKLVQDKLGRVLEEINSKYQKDIISNFVITLGDEFQGLLSGGNHILQIIDEIRGKLYPVELRFGIGIGRITTDIDTKMALGADGPGYYKARNAIEILKENEKKNKAVISDIRIEAEDANIVPVVLINTIFELIKAIEQDWTDRQREIIWDMQEHQDGQKQVAERFGIGQSSVSKVFLKGKYYVYAKSKKNVEEILGAVKL